MTAFHCVDKVPDLEETILEHHTAEKLDEVDSGSLQCCLTLGLKLVLLMLEEQPGHWNTWTGTKRAIIKVFHLDKQCGCSIRPSSTAKCSIATCSFLC